MSSITTGQTFFPCEFKHNKEKWTTIGLCGEGTFSQCFHIRNESGRNLAVKVYKPGKRYEVSFQNEIEMLSLVKIHSVSYMVNYINILTVFGRNSILMELLGCSLKDLLIQHDMKGFSIFLVKKILHNLSSAVMYLDERGIVHGDIKFSNVLWDMNLSCFKLIDFSISFKSGMPRSEQPLQSLGYQAPEVLEWNKKVQGNKFTNEENYSDWLDTAIDMWSIGCVLVHAISGQQLYSIEHAQQIPRMCTNCELKCAPCVHSVRSKNLITSIRTELSVCDINNLNHILCGLLQCHPCNRIRPKDIIKHSFLVSHHCLEASITDLVFLATKVLRLLNMFDETEIDDIDDIIVDIREQCEKFGPIISMTSKKKNEGYNIYVEYNQAENCCKARRTLTGSYFGNRFVVATFFPWQHFVEKNLY